METIVQQYPVGIMHPVDIMQTTPCECQSFSNGVSTGIGIAVGLGLVAGITVGIYKLYKKR